MSSPRSLQRAPEHGEQAGHGFWLIVACCVPMILIFALIALRVI